MRQVGNAGEGQSSYAPSGQRSRGRNSARRQQNARRVLSRAVLPVLSLEVLETRTLLATLPVPSATSHPDISGGGNNINQSSPSISYDPVNPLKMVTVYTTNNPNANGDQT